MSVHTYSIVCICQNVKLLDFLELAFVNYALSQQVVLERRKHAIPNPTIDESPQKIFPAKALSMIMERILLIRLFQLRTLLLQVDKCIRVLYY